MKHCTIKQSAPKAVCGDSALISPVDPSTIKILPMIATQIPPTFSLLAPSRLSAIASTHVNTGMHGCTMPASAADDSDVPRLKNCCAMVLPSRPSTTISAWWRGDMTYQRCGSLRYA